MSVYLLDMDGTVYLGNELIKGADYFFKTLKNNNQDYVFLTNNSSKAAMSYVEKLHQLNVPVNREQIFTSGDATIYYLKNHFPNIRKIFLLGTESLRQSFLEAGYELSQNREEIELVVLGFDTTLTYEKLWIACDVISKQKYYIATHPDFVCPLEQGNVMPDIGAMIAFIEAVTKIRPKIIGKPHREMVDALIARYGYCKEDLIMVGDRLYTDIALGENAGISTVLVLSGETTPEMARESSIKANYTFPSIYELAKFIEGAKGE